MAKPIAVVGADVHVDLPTKEVAIAALRQMVVKANELNVPLVIAGDLHTTKAHLRAECEEAIIRTLQEAKQEPVILIGNHCRRNERSPEHALHFLNGVAQIIDRPCTWDRGSLRATLIPYQHDPEDFRTAINQGNPLVICHQGIIGADMGHYVQDKSAITKKDVENYRVISGHYHRRQDIKCGRPRKGAVGLYSYVGNPYSLTFGEAKDPEKGYQILMDDGTLEFVPTNLRKHRIIEIAAALVVPGAALLIDLPAPQDLVWVKVLGTSAELAQLKKKYVAEVLLGREDFKYDPIRTDVGTEGKVTPKMSSTEAMDAIIDGSPDEEARKAELKRLYRELMP